MDSHDEGTRWRFPTDVFVEILLRLPANTRRRFRLVSRHWRNIVDESSLMLPHRPKTLVITDGGSPFVIDDRTGRRRDLWTSSTHARCKRMRIVGTCNGLVCLCDDGVPGGAITVANPVTGETLDVLRLPLPAASNGDVGKDQCHWHHAYSFGYHPATRQYKVVHVPCRFNDWEFQTLQVLTLGEASWRDVVIPTIYSGCNLAAGIVSINGTTYWISVNMYVMSFDLEEKCVKHMSQLRSDMWFFLAEVKGSLAFVVQPTLESIEDIEVWVMDNPQWSLLYSLKVSLRPRVHQRLTRTHFVQDSGHILTWGSTSGHGSLYKHRLPNNDTTSNPQTTIVEINDTNQGAMVADIESCFDTWLFPYIETLESLSGYTHLLMKGGTLANTDTCTTSTEGTTHGLNS